METTRMTTLAALALGAGIALGGAAASAQESVKLGIVAFLSGPAAGPFGVPAKNAAELVIDAMNAGKLPPPYDGTPTGLAGATVEATYIDEAGGTTTQVTEMRNLVQRQNVDAIVGYISSGSCLAVAPVAEELQVLTVLFDCGTPRIFEENDYTYVFRTAPHATMDSVGAARYVVDHLGEIESYAGINQNYAWGQDSWRDFTLSMDTLAPDATIETELFPKLFAGEYGSEVSALQVSAADALHTSLWGGDLESFLFQSIARGLPQQIPFVLTTGETAMFRLADQMPEGTILGARGPHGVLAQDSEINDWFQSQFAERYGEPPIYSAYHMAQALLGLKAAYDKAAEEAGGFPSQEQVIQAFEGLEFQAVGSKIQMSLGNGHQGVSETAYGVFKLDDGEPTIAEVIRYPAACVNPPEDQDSVAWLEAGMPGAECE